MNEKSLKRLFIPFEYDKKKITKGDGRLYNDAILLNEGEFSDSITRSPVVYTGDELSKAAIRWSKGNKYFGLDDERTYLNLDHKPDETLKRIGYVTNVHFANKALKGDLFLHCLTDNSRDTKTLIDAGFINHLSVEIMTQDRWEHIDDKRYAEEINLLAVAVVTLPADSQTKIK